MHLIPLCGAFSKKCIQRRYVWSASTTHKAMSLSKDICPSDICRWTSTPMIKEETTFQPLHEMGYSFSCWAPKEIQAHSMCFAATHSGTLKGIKGASNRYIEVFETEFEELRNIGSNRRHCRTYVLRLFQKPYGKSPHESTAEGMDCRLPWCMKLHLFSVLFRSSTCSEKLENPEAIFISFMMRSARFTM